MYVSSIEIIKQLNVSNRFDFIAKALSDASARGQLRSLKTVRGYCDSKVTIDGSNEIERSANTELNSEHQPDHNPEKNPEQEIGATIHQHRLDLINLCSNDYLRLSEHPQVISESNKYTEMYGTGSTASRLVAGNWEYHEVLERQVASWLKFEAALVFSSGYQLNSTIIPALSDRNTTLFYDKLNHNSLVQGALASKGKLLRYKHLDYAHLETLLAREDTQSRKIIVTESVFSMDGDVANIRLLTEIARKYNAILIVDEAHAVGVFGEEGRGISAGVAGVDLLIGTFGKSFGSAGAFVACSEMMRDYLINFCAGFIFSTAPPPSVIGANIRSLEHINSMSVEREYVQVLSNWVRDHLKRMGFDILRSESHIIPIVIGSEVSTLKLSEFLQRNGFLCQAIRPPTVEQGKSRLRITLNAKLTKEDMQRFLEVLQNYVSSEHDTI